MGTVRIIDPSRDKRWDSFVESHPNGTLYHLSCWKNVLEKTFGYTPLYYVLEDENGDIKGGMPLFSVRSFITGNRLVSLPFSDYCNLLVGSDDEFQLILTAILSGGYGKAGSFIRLCLRDCTVDLERYGFRLEAQYKNHVLQVDKPSEVIRRTVIDSSRRRNLQMAARSGVSVIYSRGEKDLEAYYRMYILTRKKHGLVPLPYRFFQNVWATLAPRGMAYLVLAKMHSRTIAGIVLLRDKNTLYCLSNASMQQYLACRPNDLLWWEGIELAAREGLLTFDFGRTSATNRGLLSFKRKWRTVERDIKHYVLPLSSRRRGDQSVHISNGAVKRLVKLMPSCLLRLGGELAYRLFG